METKKGSAFDKAYAAKLRKALEKAIFKLEQELEGANYHSMMHVPQAIADAVEKHAGTQAAINVLEDLEATIVE